MDIEWNPDGSATTGLLAWCRIVLTWAIWLDDYEIIKRSGVVPKSFLRNAIEKHNAAIHPTW